MENIFSNSSVVDEIVTEVKKQDSAATPASPFEDIASEIQQDEFAKTSAAARWARKYDPQSYAQARNLMPGLDPEVGVRQLELLKDSNYLAKYKDVFSKSPQLRGYFAQNPKDLPLAHPDELDKISGLSWLGSAGGQALSQGFTDVNAAMASERIAKGNAQPGDYELVKSYVDNAGRTFGADSWFQEVYVMAAQQAGPLVHMAKGSIRGAFILGSIRAAAGAAIGAAGGAVGGSVVPGPGTAAGGAAGAASGAAVGLVEGAAEGVLVGGYLANASLQRGQARMYFQTIRDENGQPLDPQLVEFASSITGAGGAALETLSDAVFAKAVPGAGKVTSLITKEGMAKALTQPTVRKALLGFLKNTSESVGAEVATEVLQQGLQIAAGEYAKANSEGDFKAITPDEAAAQMYDAGMQALQVMSLIAPLASGTRLGADLKELNANKQAHDNLNKVEAALEGNQLVERAPDVAQQLIDKQLGDQKLYIPATEAQALYQSEGKDFSNLPMRNWRERLNEALAVDGEVEITVGEYVAHLNKDPKANPLRDLVRTSPGGYSKAEIQNFSDTLDKLLLSEVAQAKKVSETIPTQAQAQPIEIFPEMEQLKQQIKAVGYTPDAVEKFTTLFTAIFNTAAQRAGITPSELFQQYGVEVQRGLGQIASEGSVDPNTFFQELTAAADVPVPETQVVDHPVNGTLLSPPLEQTSIGTDKAPIVRQGSVQFNKTRSIISIYETGNMSTLLHETGHVYLNMLRDLAKTYKNFQTDWDIAKKRLGIGEDGQITREQHEKFAKMAEAYFYEGKAPSPELKSMMQSFSHWMKAIYKSIKKLGTRLSPEIRGVFDRMLATEQRINELAADRAYAPLIRDAAEYGLTAEEYLQYQNLIEDLKQDAVSAAREKIVGQSARFEKGWMENVSKELQKEFENKLKQTPPYSTAIKLKDKKVLINPDSMDKYSPESKRAFPREAFRKDGLDVSVAAELLGYATADDMVYDFVNSPSLKDAAKDLTHQEMVWRYGEDYTNPEILDAAIKAKMAQDARLTVLSTEYNALRKKAGTGKGSVSQAVQLSREIARNVLYRKQVKEISVTKTQAAVDRLATRVDSTVAKGDWRAAADYKRQQLMAQALANESVKVSDTVEKIRNKAGKYARKASKSVDPSYMEQIRNLVSQYEFAKITDKKLNKRISLREFIDQVEQDGQVVVDIPSRLLNEANRINYKELSVEELLGLGDLLDNLEHLGRTKNKLRTAQAARLHEDLKNQIVERIRQRPSKPQKMDTYSKPHESIADKLMDFHASLLKPEQIIEWADMGDIRGPMMENIFQPIADAEVYQNDMMAKYNEKLIKIFEGISSSELSEVMVIPSLNTKMTREEIYAVALNTGNLSSKKKLLEGELWSEVQLADVLSHLKKDDWKRIQKVWDVLDSLWPEISKLVKKLTGVAPPRVEGAEFTNQHGTFRGGYYPVIYDFKSARGKNLVEDTTPVDKKMANWLQDNRYVLPGTSHKHTVARTKVAKPIKLSLGILPAYIQTVIHDLAYREPVRSAYKLLWDPEVKKALSDVEGEAVYKQLQHWLKAVATERPVIQDEVLPLLSRVRAGATLYGMGYRLSTAIAQPLGFFNTMVRVNKAHLLNGIYKMATSPWATMDMVNGLSGEMRHRFNQQDRDIKDTVKKLALADSKLDKFRAYAFYMIGAADKFVSTASWVGAYSEYLQKNPKDIDGAIRTGDRVVRLTQGAGSVKDLAKVMNSGEWMRLFTMFYSFFSGQYNAQVDLTRKTANDIKAGNIGSVLTERLPQWMYLVVFPAVFGALVTGQGPEEGENKLWWATRKTLLYPATSVPFLREVVSAAESGYDYKITPATKFFESTLKAWQKVTDWDATLDERVGAALRPAAEAASIYFRLPTGAIMNTIEGLWDGATSGDYKYEDILLGRRPK